MMNDVSVNLNSGEIKNSLASAVFVMIGELLSPSTRDERVRDVFYGNLSFFSSLFDQDFFDDLKNRDPIDGDIFYKDVAVFFKLLRRNSSFHFSDLDIELGCIEHVVGMGNLVDARNIIQKYRSVKNARGIRSRDDLSNTFLAMLFPSVDPFIFQTAFKSKSEDTEAIVSSVFNMLSKSGYFATPNVVYTYFGDWESAPKGDVPSDPVGRIKWNSLHNLSADLLIVSMRGKGKSSLGISIAKKLNRNFTVDNIVFTLEDYIKKVQTLSAGDVIVFDETGTMNSGSSSRRSMTETNQKVNDFWQLSRVFGVISIFITLDSMRLDKRIRDTFPFVLIPEKKLSNSDTNGNGYAIYAKILERESYYNRDNSDLTTYLNEMKTPSNSKIAGIIVQNDADLLKEYEIKRFGSAKSTFTVFDEKPKKKAQKKQKATVEELQNLTVSQLTKKYSVSRGTVYNWRKKIATDKS